MLRDSDVLECIFHWLSAYGRVFFCWDFRIGVRLWEVVATVFLKKCPGPQTSVHWLEVSASGGSIVFMVRLQEKFKSDHSENEYSWELNFTEFEYLRSIYQIWKPQMPELNSYAHGWNMPVVVVFSVGTAAHSEAEPAQAVRGHAAIPVRQNPRKSRRTNRRWHPNPAAGGHWQVRRLRSSPWEREVEGGRRGGKGRGEGGGGGRCTRILQPQDIDRCAG